MSKDNGEMKRRLALIFIAAALMTATGVCCACGGKNPPPSGSDLPLAAPVLSISDTTISWSGIEHATGYDVYVNGGTAESVTATSYELAGRPAGEYSVRVKATTTEAGYSPESEFSNTVTCNIAKIAVRLVKTAEPEKTRYVAGETTALDLIGFSAAIEYSNAAADAVTLTAADVITEYDLSVPGRYEIEFEKNGLIGAAFRINVVEADTESVECAEVVNAWEFYVPKDINGNPTGAGYWKYDADTYNVVPDGLNFTPTLAVKSDETQIAVSGGHVDKTALGMGETLLRLTDGTNSTYVKAIVAKGISDVDGYKSIADDMSGYYRLMNRVDIKNAVMIGKTPFVIDWETPAPTPQNPTPSPQPASIELDRTGVGDPDAPGVAFTGTFDGAGYVLANYSQSKAGYGYHERYKGMGCGIFGWIGKTGTVKNVVLSNCFVGGMNNTGLVAGYNEGTIENITIDETCRIRNFYWVSALVCPYNYGTVRNVVSYIDKAELGSGPSQKDYGILMIATEQDGSDELCPGGYMMDYSDLTGSLGEGWRYFDGIGTVYCNDKYKKLLDYDEVWCVGSEAEFSVLFADPTAAKDYYVHAWGAYKEAATRCGYTTDGNKVTFRVKYSTGTVGGTATVMPQILGDGDGYFASMSVTVGAPKVKKIDGTGDFSAVVNADINLNAVPITITYTDGTTASGHPTGYVESTYDNTRGNVKQLVTFYYEDDGKYFYAAINVTPAVPTGDYVTSITIAKKSVVGKMVYDATSGVNFDNYLTFTFVHSANANETVTMAAAGITVEPYESGKTTVTFKYKNPGMDYTAQGSIELELWYGITDADEWSKLNDNLAGYFILKKDIDFGQTGVTVGAIPIDVATNTFSFADPDGNGIPFTGKFDGDGHTIKNFKTTDPGGFDVSASGRNLFGYIGSGADVGNFDLDNVVTSSCNYSSFIAGCNAGAIHDVNITGGSVTSRYHVSGAFACYNYGSITDCSCDTPASGLPDVYEGPGTVTNCTRGA